MWREPVRVARRPKGSSSHHGVVKSTARKTEARVDILDFEIGEILEHLLHGQSARQEIEHVRDANTHPSDAWTAAALLRIHRDSFRKVRHRNHLRIRVRATRPSADRQGALKPEGKAWDGMLSKGLGDVNETAGNRRKPQGTNSNREQAATICPDPWQP